MDQPTQTPTQNPKQQVVEALKSATNVLVTVSADPSVDQLSACIGLTLMLNKLNKHGTAVFSGAIPSTIEFLQPEKTIEATTDSLRDFIISLDRSKADKLRYKVEDNVVKIFITPYRTSLSGDDLEFSRGDFNVDVVVALGVDDREHLDTAIKAHGQILHDATVVGLSCGDANSDIGSINWHEQTASSLCEMLVSISEAFQSGVLDAQMSTAFLTGIVAETDRFKNEKTTPKVMTMSAQLMAAGANQQLIASQLALPPQLPEDPAPPVEETPLETPPLPETEDTTPEEPEEPQAELPEVQESPKTDEFAVSQDEAVDAGSPLISLQGDSSLAPVITESPDGAAAVDQDIEQIEIDNNGHVEGKDAARRGHEKVLEPLTMKPQDNGPKTDLSNYVFDEKSQAAASVSPVGNSTNDQPSPVATSAQDVDVPAAVVPNMDNDQPIDPEQVIKDMNSSMPKVETSVAPEVQSNSSIPASPDEDSARQAVLNAIGATQQPVEALNAMPMPLEPLPEDALPPPTVPPPMTPPMVDPSMPIGQSPVTTPTTNTELPPPNNPQPYKKDDETQFTLPT